MGYGLHIDDQWDDPATPNRRPPDNYAVARSSEQAIDHTEAFGVPEKLSLDYDLGYGDTVMVYLRYLTENHYDAPIPEYRIHSENPIGRLNIESLMESWRRSKQ